MISVLYIDDDFGLLERFQNSLEGSGYFAVDTGRSTQEARKRLGQTAYDAIISENAPPTIDGIQLLREIKNSSPSLPFIFFTRENAGEVILDALNTGADFYQRKGEAPETQFAGLAIRISSLVNSRQSARLEGHLARLYRILSQINTASASLRNRNTLMEEACRVAVHDGGFLMVWIGLIHRDTGWFEPVAYCNRTGDRLDALSPRDDTLLVDAAPTSIAIRRGLYYASTDNRHDPRLAPWRTQLLANGFVSSAAFPLRIGNRVIGAMTFHAGEPAFFSEEEIQLLSEMTDNLSLAFELMEKEYSIAELTRLSDALQLANKKLNLLSNITRHDTLNQLTALGGYIELARMHATDSVMLEYIGKEDRAVESIRQQITFTREYQDIGVQAPIWQNVQEVVKRAIGTASMGQITVRSEPGTIEIFADPLLEKVFFNLLENTKNHGKTATRMKITARESDEGLVITCEDDGDGVPENEKENIFNRKFYKNTGFGLFLSREILAITAIQIRETGETGRGARFEIIVPKEKFRAPPLKGIR
ncbi:ATP-binding protein [Methanoregula sp.]|uniref:ATP-binding protein n=1 Tax=Methanoregula sp. TaxID=2052170 RepID=UPI0035690356